MLGPFCLCFTPPKGGISRSAGFSLSCLPAAIRMLRLLHNGVAMLFISLVAMSPANPLPSPDGEQARPAALAP